MSRTGQSLLEVVVASGLLVSVAATTLGAFVSTSEHVGAATIRQANIERCRRLADALARELRDANAVAADLAPPAPFEAASLGYRTVLGLDAATLGPLLSPTRESGEFRRVALEGDQVVVDAPTGRRILASGVAGLRLTLVAPRLLEVDVACEGRAGDGQLLRDRARVLVALENELL